VIGEKKQQAESCFFDQSQTKTAKKHLQLRSKEEFNDVHIIKTGV